MTKEQLIEALNQKQIYATVRKVNNAGTKRWLSFYQNEDNSMKNITKDVAELGSYKMSDNCLVADGGGMNMVVAVLKQATDNTQAAEKYQYLD